MSEQGKVCLFLYTHSLFSSSCVSSHSLCCCSSVNNCGCRVILTLSPPPTNERTNIKLTDFGQAFYSFARFIFLKAHLLLSRDFSLLLQNSLSFSLSHTAGAQNGQKSPTTFLLNHSTSKSFTSYKMCKILSSYTHACVRWLYNCLLSKERC